MSQKKGMLFHFILIVGLGTGCSYSGNNEAPLSSYNYDDNYKDIALIFNQEVAVLLAAYNRPEYFKECIKSIEQTPESTELIFIFALDGGPKSKQAENIAIIENSTIKNKIILLRQRNYGCPKNHIDSKRFAFEWCKFKKLIIMEEDVKISPHYFTFLLNFHQWANATYDNIGAVQAWSKCYLSKKQKQEKLNLIKENPEHWSFLTYCIDDICWQKIRSLLYTYEDFIDQIPHTDEYAKQRSKPHNWKDIKKIVQWVHQTVKNKKKIQRSPSHLASKLSLKEKILSPKFPASQDQTMAFTFYMNDLVKLQTVVNRVIHIGKHGITTNEKKYNSMYKPIHLDIYEEDKRLASFKMQ